MARSYNNSFSDNREKLFDKDAWGMATVGLSLATLLLSVLIAVNFSIQLNLFLKILAGLLGGLLLLLVFALASLLLVRRFGTMPEFFIVANLAAFATVLLLSLVTATAFDLVYFAIMVLFLVMQAFFFGCCWVLFSGRARRLQFSRFVLCVTVLLAVPLLDAGFIYLLNYPGSDSPVAAAEPDLEGARTSRLLRQVAGKGRYGFTTLTYGSQQEAVRPEYGSQATLKVPAFNATAYAKGFKGLHEQYSRWYHEFEWEKVPVNGKVYLPEGKGPFPLVVVAHGNHFLEKPSEKGFEYLAERLASHGFATVLPDFNFMNRSWAGDFGESGTALNARLLLKHLMLLQQWQADSAHVYYKKLSLDSTALVCHGEGCESAFMATAFQQAQALPEAPGEATGFQFRIGALVALSPLTLPGSRRRQVRDLDYLAIHPSHNPLLPGAVSFYQQAVMLNNDSERNFMANVYLQGGNHSQFNSQWERSMVAPPRKWLVNYAGLLLPARQQQATATLVTAFLQASVYQKIICLQYFRQVATTAQAGADYKSRFFSSGMVKLLSFDEDPNPLTALPDSASVSGRNLLAWQEVPAIGPDNAKTDYRLLLAWRQTVKQQVYGEPKGDSVAGYTLHLPSAFLQQKALTDSSRLYFSLAAVPVPEADGAIPLEGEEAVLPDPLTSTDFTIEFVDTVGIKTRFAFSNLGKLPLQAPVHMLKLQSMSKELYPHASQAVLQTFYLPFSEIKRINPGFLLSAVKEISLIFDRTPVGAILLDDVAFWGLRELPSQPEAPQLQRRYGY